MENKTKVICLTPVRNEGWILEKFLKATSLWADHIIIGDQNSEDNTLEIARKFPKVTIVHNDGADFNETQMRSLLLEEARKIEGKRLLISLDADEIFTANYMTSPEWQTMLDLPEGSIIKFPFVNLGPDPTTHHTKIIIWAAFMDDNKSSIMKRLIHLSRVPYPDSGETVMLYTSDIRVLHYPYLVPERQASKYRWYQCFEHLFMSTSQPVKLYRSYYRPALYRIRKEDYTLYPTQPEWFEGYREKGVDITSIQDSYSYWWDERVLSYFEEHGTKKFKKLFIWYIDWMKMAKGMSMPNPERFADPRNILDKLVGRYAVSTQGKEHELYVKIIDKLLKFIGY